MSDRSAPGIQIENLFGFKIHQKNIIIYLVISKTFYIFTEQLKTTDMQRKGYYTGKRVFAPFFQAFTIIGKISGYRGNGEPVYDLLVKGEKVGEMGNPEIKKNRKLYYDLTVISKISITNI